MATFEDTIRGLNAAKPKPKLYRWPTDPKGKAPRHTVTYKQHQYNRTPIVPGSSINQKTLDARTNAATQVKYGALDLAQKQAVNQARNYAADIGGPGGFYDQYLAKLREHQQAINAIGAQAQTAMQGLQSGVTGLSQATLAPIQAQANAQAAMGGMGPAGNLAPLASNAAAVRQALVGSFGADQAARNAAAQQYADTLSNVVGPTQKLSGQVQAQKGIAAAREARAQTAREKGAFKFQYAEDQRDAERKLQTALEAAGIKSATDLARTEETHRHNVATERNTAAGIRNARDKAIRDAAAKGNQRADSGPFAGLTASQIAGLSDAKAKSLVDKYNAMLHPGKTGGGSVSGPDLLTPGQMGIGLSQASAIKDLAARAKAGQPFIPAHAGKDWKKRPLDRAHAEAKIRAAIGPKTKNPFLIRAAVDAVYDGHLSAYTVQHLLAGGYKPREVAAALGVKTHDDWLKTPAGQAWLKQQNTPLPKPPGKPTLNVGGTLGGFPR